MGAWCLGFRADDTAEGASMGCGSGGQRGEGDIAGAFWALAREYRRVAACVGAAAEACDAEGVQRSQVLDIAFGSVVKRISEGADLMEAIAGRFRDVADESENAAASSPLGGADSAAAGSADATPVRVPSSLQDASRLLVAAARALEGAMLRALDLTDEADRPDLVGDSHPFGHIIHGICVPYLLLAAEELERR